MDSWILLVLFLILLELMWIGSRLPTGSQDLVGELKKIQEELEWFKKDNFASHLLNQIESSVGEVKEELLWFKDDKFAGNLLKEMNKHVGGLIESLDGIKSSLDEIENGLTTANLNLEELKEIASNK